MFKLELLAQAEDEFSESYDWYDEQQTGLGSRFYKEVNHYLELIENDPYKYPIRYDEEIRTAVLKIFPFLIIYWIDETKQIIHIISVFHTSRDPQF